MSVAIKITWAFDSEVPTRKVFMEDLKTETTRLTRILKRTGGTRLLHRRTGFSSSVFCGKNLRKDDGAPRRVTRRKIEYTVENIVAFPNSPGLISHVVMGVMKKEMNALNQVPREKEMYFFKRSCSLRVI
jgi:hypothetical protein